MPVPGFIEPRNTVIRAKAGIQVVSGCRSKIPSAAGIKSGMTKREEYCGTANVHRSNDHGFTLIEILIVITILGILASLVAVRLMDRPGEARAMKAKMDIQALENALKLYKIDNAVFPTTEQGLRALVERPLHGRIPKSWREGGYLEKGVVPKDPWNNDYLYQCPGVYNRDFDLWSYGANGEEGGEGEDGDVTNWFVDKQKSAGT